MWYTVGQIYLNAKCAKKIAQRVSGVEKDGKLSALQKQRATEPKEWQNGTCKSFRSSEIPFQKLQQL